MRYVLLIYTNEADRPAWGSPDGDAEAKGYDAFHGEVTQHGLFRGGGPPGGGGPGATGPAPGGQDPGGGGPPGALPLQRSTFEVRPVLELPA